MAEKKEAGSVPYSMYVVDNDDDHSSTSSSATSAGESEEIETVKTAQSETKGNITT